MFKAANYGINLHFHISPRESERERDRKNLNIVQCLRIPGVLNPVWMDGASVILSDEIHVLLILKLPSIQIYPELH